MMDGPFEGSVAVIGLGYIGLPTAVAMATHGLTVHGVDVNQEIVDAVSRGVAPFVEPDLAVGVGGAVASGRLSASTQIPEADAYIIAVPTPFLDDHTADMSYVRRATEQVAPHLRPGAVVVLESTSPPGSTDQISNWLAELRPDLLLPHQTDSTPDIFVAHCPERVLPGRIMVEMVTNDRVVGGVTRVCAERAAAIYRRFCQGKIVVTDSGSAEMAKLVENAFRDVNIAFANELSLICDRLRLDVWEIISLANHHPRVNILSPGPGVGGHCIAVDPWFIVGAAPDEARLIRASREVNDSKPHHVATQVIEKVARFKEPTVACLGLTFKANVDDVRESPAVDVIRLIGRALPDLDIRVADPYVRQLPLELSDLRIKLQSAQDAVEDADIVVLLVDHEAFRSLNLSRLVGKVVYDTRGLWR
jgi:UDP-N-acetyl-D-mannosaminuronic acid dehydrogenase